MGDWPELERRLDALYVAVRDGTVDRQAAFDIAMNELEYSPRNVRASELAGRPGVVERDFPFRCRR
jgi:hypothetical protein